LIKEWEKVKKILTFDNTTILSVAEEKEATVIGTIILLFSPIANLLLLNLSSSYTGGFFSRYFMWPLFLPVLTIVGTIFIVHFILEKYFKRKENVVGFYRVVAYSSVLFWISTIQFLLSLIFGFDPFIVFNFVWIVVVIWLTAVVYHVFLYYYKLKQDDAVKMTVASVFIYLVVQWVLGRILVGKFYRFFY